jgi:nucleoside-diphosphate-sugar epimerase
MRNSILITGSSGFLGSSLVNFFLKKNFKVYSLDQKKNYIKHKNHFFFKSSIKNFFKKKNRIYYKVIIHTAAISKNFLAYKYPEKTLSHNVLNLLEILKFLKKKKRIRLIFFSTNQIDEDKKKFGHLHPYSLSKQTCEDILKFYSYYYQIKIINIRLFDIYSSLIKNNKPLFKNLIDKLKENKSLYIKKDHNLKLIHITEIFDLVLKIIKNKQLKKFTNYNFIIKNKVNLLKIVSFFKKKIKSKSKIFFLKRDFKKKYEEFNLFKLIKLKKEYLTELSYMFENR